LRERGGLLEADGASKEAIITLAATASEGLEMVRRSMP
jgi:hypothetical protein